jgi:hypothetical protein
VKWSIDAYSASLDQDSALHCWNVEADCGPLFASLAPLPVWRRRWYGKVQRLASGEATWLRNRSCFRTILPGPTFSLPCGNANLPRANVDLPRGNVNLPGGNVNLPRANFNLPRGNVNLPRGNVDLPCGRLKLP